MKLLRMRRDDYRAVLEDETGYWTQTTHGLLYAGTRENAMALWRADEREEEKPPAPVRRRRAPKWDFEPAPKDMAQMMLFN